MSDEASREAAIRVQGLTKSFGGRPVIRDLDMTLQQGQTLTIVGHNGSGKTTLIRLLAGLARPDAGIVRVHGIRQSVNAVSVHRTIGMVSHNTFLYQDLTSIENLQFYGRLYDVVNLDQRIDILLRQFGLEGYRGSQVRTLSRGTQQRLSLARALLADPSIILLDEPDSGLDPQGVDMLPALLQMADLDDRTILVTTHNLKLGLTLARRVAILSRGSLAWQHDTQTLTEGDLRDAYDTHLPRSDRVLQLS